MSPQPYVCAEDRYLFLSVPLTSGVMTYPIRKYVGRYTFTYAFWWFIKDPIMSHIAHATHSTDHYQSSVHTNQNEIVVISPVPKLRFQ